MRRSNWLILFLVVWLSAMAHSQTKIVQGPQGPRGFTGARGPAATVQIGTVTVVAADTAPTVTNVGTSTNAIFNFTIPRGSKIYSGSGAPSVGTGAAGDWYFDTTNACLYGPKTTVWPGSCMNLGTTIAVGTTTTLAAGSPATVNNSGTSGHAVFDFGIPRGDTGPQGDVGPQGPSGTAAVGTVTTLAPGSPATVVNSGTPSAAVYDFGIPKGDTGPQGAPGSPITGLVEASTTIQNAFTAAGSTGAVVIPSSYSGNDTYTNPNFRPLLDLRRMELFRGDRISVRDFGASGDSGYYPSVGVTAGATSVSINAVWKVGNLTNGTPIKIQGAGAAGADYSGTITGVVGGVISFTPATSTTVSNVAVWWGHDDTAAVQAAINYAHNKNGGKVVFPNTGGNYQISNVTIPAIDNSVTLKRGGITIECEGRRQSTYLLATGADQVGMIQVLSGAHATKITGCAFAGVSWNSSAEIYRSFTTGDTSTNFISVPNNAIMNTTSVSIGMDFNAASAPVNNTWIVAKNSSVNPPSYGFKMNASGQLTCVSTDNFNNQVVSPAASAGVWNGAWHRAVCTVDTATTLKVHLFVDGAEVGTGTAYPNAIGYSGASVFSMGGSSGSSTGVVIKIAKVWMKNSALTVSAATSQSNLAAADPAATVMFPFLGLSPEVDTVANLQGTVTGTTTGTVGGTPARHPIAIDIQGGIEHWITDNYFDSGLYHAIKATSTFNNRIDFNRFYGPWDSCIKFVSGASAVIDTRISDNEAGVCGASHIHGWFVEQLSQGGGGSNWLHMIQNDCEGTEWSGCYYMYAVSDYIIQGGRTEVDSGIGDGSWAALYNDNSQGLVIGSEMSGGITIKSGGVHTIRTNLYPSSITGCAVTFPTGFGGGLTIEGDGFVSQAVRSNLCGDPAIVAGVRFINHAAEGFLNENSMHIFDRGTESSNTRKQTFMDQYGPNGGSVIGWGNQVQGASNTAAQRLPAGVTGQVLQNGDRIYNSYWPNNGALNGAWVCTSATCSFSAGAWTGTFYYINYDAVIRRWGTAAPASGYGAVGDRQFNTNWDGTSATPYMWLCTVAGAPGTWVAKYIIDPASPGTLGGTTPAPATFTNVTVNGTTTEQGAVTLNNSHTINQPTQGTVGQQIKAAASGAPNTITCGGSCTLQAWYKADALALTDGANVTSWADSSGNSHTLSVTGTAPVYHTNVANGQPAVQFTNVTTGKLTSASWTFTGAYTVIWAALKPTSYATDCQFISDSGLNNFHYPLSTATNWSMRNNGGSAGFPSYTATGYPDNGLMHIISNTVGNPNSVGYVDGTQVVTNTTATSFRDWQGGFGINLFSTCSATLGEVMIYSGLLDTASRRQVEAYLGIKYGIGAAAANLIEVQNNAGTHIAGISPSGKLDAKGVAGGLNSMTFSATPTFDASTANTFKMTLTGNVTSSTLIGATAGQNLHFVVCLDGVGSETFAWPANFFGGMTIGTTASKCNMQSFIFDGTSAYATGAGLTNQ